MKRSTEEAVDAPEEISKMKEIFMTGVKSLEPFVEIRKTRPLTKEESYYEGKIRYTLYQKIERMVKNNIKRRLSNFKKDSDLEEQALSKFKQYFFQKLDDYVFEKGEPSTFVSKLIIQSIRETKETSQHMNQHEATNFARVNNLRKECKVAGIEPDVEILHQMSLRNDPSGKGISIKIIKQVLYRSENSSYVDVTDMTEASSVSDPLSLACETEKANKIHDLIMEKLEPEDAKLFLAFCNLDSDSRNATTYKKIADMFHMEKHEVTSKINKIRNKLSSEILDFMQITNFEDSYNSSVSLIDSSTNEMEDDIMNFFKS